MTLEQEVNNARKEADKGLWRLNPIDPASTWDWEKFVASYKGYRDTQRDFEKFQKAPTSHEALSDLAGRLYKTPDGKPDTAYYLRNNMEANPIAIDRNARLLIERARDSLRKYGSAHVEDLLNEIAKEEAKKPVAERRAFKDIILSVPIYNSDGEDKEHDDYVATINHVRNLAGVMQEEDEGKRIETMKKVVAQDIMRVAGGDPYIAQIVSANLYNPTWVQNEFKRIYSRESKAVFQTLSEERAIELIKKNAQLAEREYKEEPDRFDSKQLRDLAWAPTLDKVEPIAFKILKARKDKDKRESDPDEMKQYNREQRRARMGLPL